MAVPPSRPRKGKRLLVAAVGVATVSFVSSQGCEPRTETITSGNLLPAPPYEAGAEPAALRDAGPELPTRDDLLPAQAIDASEPALDAAGKDAGHSLIPPSGNLLPVPARQTKAR